MDSPDKNSILPSIPGLNWRSLQPDDVAAIASLATVCLTVDGGLPQGLKSLDNDTDTYVQEHYLPAWPGTSIGAFEMDGRLFSFAAVQPTDTPQEYLTTIVGQVHPDYRRRGIGSFLLRWSIAEAGRILAACPPDRTHVLQITTELLTEAAARLFERHGFMQKFAEDVMRCDLSTPIPDILLPSGIKFLTWVPALAGRFFAVHQVAFRERPGYPGWSQEEWMAWAATDDDDFRPEASLLACHDGLPVGYILCDDEWIIQIGVRPEWRGKGIGSALVKEVLRRFRAAGSDYVLICVNVNYPRAARVYTRAGFERVGRRARYLRVLT